MAGLNNIREAYQQVYSQIDERMDPEERALRRAEVADKKASRMDAKVASKYAGSEARSAEREDKKSKGKHIHGMADSVEVDGDLVDEGMTMKDFKAQRNKVKRSEKRQADKIAPNRRAGIHADKASPERAARHRANVDPDFEGNDERNYPGGRLRPNKVRKAKALGELGEGTMDIKGFEIPQKERDAAKERLLAKTKEIRNKKKIRESSEEVDEAVYGGEKKEPKDTRMVVTKADKTANTKAWQNYKAGHPGYRAASHVGEETLLERPLDTAETGEKERLVKGMKKSASDFKKRYGKRWKNVLYATATKQAKSNMDTSKSDRRYAVEETSMEESADLENRKKGPRKPSQIQKREKLNHLINQIRSKKEGESK